jgi:hypothetical protein
MTVLLMDFPFCYMVCCFAVFLAVLLIDLFLCCRIVSFFNAVSNTASTEILEDFPHSEAV